MMHFIIYLVDVWSDLLWTSVYKRFKCLQAVFSKLVVVLFAVLNNKWHNPLDLLSKSVTGLPTKKENICVTLLIHLKMLSYCH